mgnify:CR=1 FL=1
MWIGFEELVKILNVGIKKEKDKKTAERFKIIFDQIKNEEFGIEINKERIVTELDKYTNDKPVENESTEDEPVENKPTENVSTENTEKANQSLIHI